MNAYHCSNFVDLVREKAQILPEHRFYTFLDSGLNEEGFLSYGQLDLRARAIAQRLMALNCLGKSVLLVFPPGIEFVCGFFGCLYAGVRAVPVHPPTRRHLGRLNAIIEDSQAELVLVNSEFHNAIKTWKAAGDLTLGDNIKLLMINEIDGADAGLWKSPGVASDDIAFLQYTSGSTGQPKGVMVSHSNLIHNTKLLVRHKAVNDQTVNVTWLPQFHDMGLIDGILTPLSTGHPNYVMAPTTFSREPANWLKAIDRYKATHSGGPCFAFEYCAKAVSDEVKNTLDLSSWICAYSAAEPIRKSVMDLFSQAFHRCGFKGQHIVPAYGMAETTLVVTSKGVTQSDFCSLRVDAESLQRHEIKVVEAGKAGALDIVSCGEVLKGEDEEDCDGNRVVIVNPENSSILNEGKVGEIWVQGPSVCKGYWNKPQLTEDVFKARVAAGGDDYGGSFLRTGDLGFSLEGQIYITGRIKDVIIIRGANFYPQDIELASQSSDELLIPNGCAAFTADKNSDSVVIVQEVAPGTPADRMSSLESVIRNSIAEAIGIFVSDVVLIKFGSINKTSSGKIQRHKVQERYIKDEIVRLNEKPNKHGQNVLLMGKEKIISEEDKLVRKIKNTLKFWIASKYELDVVDINENENFVAIGIDSISVAEMIVSLEKAIGLTLEDEAVFKCQTINELVSYSLKARVREEESELKASKPAYAVAGEKAGDINAIKMAKIALPTFEVA